MRRTGFILMPLLVLVLLGGACGSGDGESDRSSAPGAPSSATTAAGTDKGGIVVGSKLDTEAKLLAEMTAQVLEGKGYRVERKIPTGPTDITRKALLAKEIDVYWEFTGTGLSLLGQDPIGDPTAAYAKVVELDGAHGVTWLPAAAMNDTYALAVEDGGPVIAASLSELASFLEEKPKTKLCADPEGGFRADVLPKLAESYGISFADVRQLGNELIPPAVAQGECQVGVVYSTAALIVKSGLRVLTDDQSAFGAYTPAPTVRADRLGRWPTLTDDLAALTAALDTPTITGLNARVDIDGEDLADVARDFLTERSLLG